MTAPVGTGWRHCASCDVKWLGGPTCWFCGERVDGYAASVIVPNRCEPLAHMVGVPLNL